MTTAGQRLVALSGLGSATAAQHFMAISAGGGGAVAVLQGVQLPFSVGAVRALTDITPFGFTVPVTYGAAGVSGGISGPEPINYSTAYDLIRTMNGVLSIGWVSTAVTTAGEAEGVVSLSGPEPAIICLDDAPGATVLTGNDAAFHLS